MSSRLVSKMAKEAEAKHLCKVTMWFTPKGFRLASKHYDDPKMKEFLDVRMLPIFGQIAELWGKYANLGSLSKRTTVEGRKKCSEPE